MLQKHNNNDLYSLSNLQIIGQIGLHLKNMRLFKNYTQEYIAQISGIDRASISSIENGRPASLLSLIQIMRALNILEDLNSFFIDPPVSPRLLAKLEEKVRKRGRINSRDKEKKEDSEW